MSERILLTPQEVATELGVHVATLSTWRYKGIGPRFVKIGQKGVMYRRADLDAYLDSRTVGSTAEATNLPAAGPVR